MPFDIHVEMDFPLDCVIQYVNWEHYMNIGITKEQHGRQAILPAYFKILLSYRPRAALAQRNTAQRQLVFYPKVCSLLLPMK